MRQITNFALVIGSKLTHFGVKYSFYSVIRESQGIKLLHINPAQKLTLAVRETSISRHTGNPINDHPYTPQYNSAGMYRVLQGHIQSGPHGQHTHLIALVFPFCSQPDSICHTICLLYVAYLRFATPFAFCTSRTCADGILLGICVHQS